MFVLCLHAGAAARKLAMMSRMQLDQIKELVKEDMEAVDQVIRARLTSDVVLINQLGHYIVEAGGKRMRPMLVVLTAKACGYEGRDYLELAAVIEFIHTATLLHDDVVDESAMRRGRDTANAVWGNEASVLVGDFLYSRAFEMMVEIGRMDVMQVMAETTRRIAEGEVLQLLNCQDPDTTEASYLEVIRSKTAKLFEASSRIGPLLAGVDSARVNALGRYGMHIGTAFQLIDDVLDFSGSSEEIGKNVGDDLAEGKPTLPLIYAIANGSPEQTEVVRRAIEQGGLDQIDRVLEAIESTGAIAYTEAMAKAESESAQRCLDDLPASDHKNALLALARFAAQRHF